MSEKEKNGFKIMKIETDKGNYFVFQVQYLKPFGQGFYTNHKGKFLSEKTSAEEEILWMEDVWDEFPMREEADENIFGRLFKKADNEQEIVPPGPAMHNPFSGLGVLKEQMED
jgi:hypothetical protein